MWTSLGLLLVSALPAADLVLLDGKVWTVQEKDRRRIESGKLADMAVLSRDILDPKQQDHIGETEVLWTIVGGKVVHEKGQ